MKNKPKIKYKSIKIKDTTYTKIVAQNTADCIKADHFIPLHRTIDQIVSGNIIVEIK